MRTCRQLYWLERSALYKTIRTPKGYSFNRLALFTFWLTYHPDLLSCVETFDMDWQCSKRRFMGIVQSGVMVMRLREWFLPRMTDLRTLVVPESIAHSARTWTLEDLPLSLERLAFTRPLEMGSYTWFCEASLLPQAASSAREDSIWAETLAGKPGLVFDSHSVLCHCDVLETLRQRKAGLRVAFGCAAESIWTKGHLECLMQSGVRFESLTLTHEAATTLITSPALSFPGVHTVHLDIAGTREKHQVVSN